MMRQGICFLGFLVMVLPFGEPSCSVDYKLLRSLRQSCKFERSTTGGGVGRVRNLSARCVYTSPNDFHYVLSWNPPELSETSVTKYGVRILFGSFSAGSVVPFSLCFQVPASQERFNFNQSMGLSYGCPFRFSVVAQPVVYGSVVVERVSGCPIAPTLNPLPNVKVNLGSSYSFAATFQYEPIPKATIRWFFSADRVNCRNLSRLQNSQSNVKISENGRVLQISKVKWKDVGCYVVTAYNGVGEENREMGYLTLTNSKLEARE